MTKVLLLWPDRGQSAESARASVADLDGVEVVVAAWPADADDGGRHALLTSVRTARDLCLARGADPNALDLLGFGTGAVAAAGLARYARRLGIGLGRVVGVAPNWDEPDPFSGRLVDEVPERIELVPDASAALALLR